MKILVLFYSTYGHIYQMAAAEAEGAGKVPGAEVVLKRVPETLPEKVLEQMGALEAQKKFSQIPVAIPDELGDYDAVIFGTPTRFGVMAAQMKAFLDATGALWSKGALVGKIGSVFTGSSMQHGGQESTILSFHTLLLHHGMIIVGLPISFKGLSENKEISGCSFYGASFVAGTHGGRMPSENELNGARFQGEHVAKLAARMNCCP